MASSIKVEIKDGKYNSKIIKFIGELDESSLSSVQEALNPVLGTASVPALLLDLSELEFTNSKGIGYIVSIHTHLAKDKRILIMAAAKEAVLDVITLVGLPTIIPYYQTLDEALGSLAG